MATDLDDAANRLARLILRELPEPPFLLGPPSLPSQGDRWHYFTKKEAQFLTNVTGPIEVRITDAEDGVALSPARTPEGRVARDFYAVWLDPRATPPASSARHSRS